MGISLSVGIYGVGKAAIHQPALAILSHIPEGAKRTFAWVGKGIVYDTGGLSIKAKVRLLMMDYKKSVYGMEMNGKLYTI